MVKNIQQNKLKNNNFLTHNCLNLGNINLFSLPKCPKFKELLKIKLDYNFSSLIISFSSALNNKLIGKNKEDLHLTVNRK